MSEMGNPRRWQPGVPRVDAVQAHRTRRTSTADAAVHAGPSLLDHLAQVEEGERLRDEGIAHADHGADIRWKVYAERVLDDLIAEGKPFTSEDLRERTGEPLAAGPTIFGVLIRGAMQRGDIEHVGWDLSRRPQAHRRPVRVWRAVCA